MNPSTSTTMTDESGVTMIEVMVVSVITAILGAVLISTLITTGRIAQVTTTRADAQDMARIHLAEAASDLRSARPLLGCVTDSLGRCVRLAETSNQSDAVFDVQNENSFDVERSFTTDRQGGVLLRAQGDLVEAAIWNMDRGGEIRAPNLLRIYVDDSSGERRLKIAEYLPQPGVTAVNAANRYRGNLGAGGTRNTGAVWDLAVPMYVRDVGKLATEKPLFHYILDSPTATGSNVISPTGAEQLDDSDAARVIAVSISPEIVYRSSGRGPDFSSVVSVTAVLRSDRLLREQNFEIDFSAEEGG